MIDRIILAKDTLITFVSELFIRAATSVLSGLGIKGMRTIIVEKGQEVQSNQYSSQQDIGKVIIYEGAIIGDHAFEDCAGISELSIAEDVTIGILAFTDCIGVTELDIAKGVTIKDKAFWGCTGITKVNIAEAVDVYLHAFFNCTGIIDVSIAEGVKIGRDAFELCTGIAEIHIAKDVRIGERVFWGCADISKLIIAKGVRVVGSAFNFNTVERFSMPEPILYFSQELVSRLSELFRKLSEQGNKEFNINITQRGLAPHQGVQSLQSLCVNTIVGSDGLKDLSTAKSIIRSQQFLASEEIEKYRCFILERNDQCTEENSKAKELYAMIRQ